MESADTLATEFLGIWRLTHPGKEWERRNQVNAADSPLSGSICHILNILYIGHLVKMSR